MRFVFKAALKLGPAGGDPITRGLKLRNSTGTKTRETPWSVSIWKARGAPAWQGGTLSTVVPFAT
jgi:hypothetical protein